jgi:hypothetical protein
MALRPGGGPTKPPPGNRRTRSRKFMDLLNPPTTTRILIKHRAPRTWPRVDLYALGMFILWLACIFSARKWTVTSTVISSLATALFIAHYCRTWKETRAVFTGAFRRTKPPTTPPMSGQDAGPAKISPGEATANPSAQDAPPAMDAHQRSLANYLSTPHLWN